MKAVRLAIGLSILLAGATSVLVAQGQQTPRNKLVVPEGTEFKLRLDTPINSKTSRVGDKIVASLVKPAYVNNEIAFPVGTRLEGQITSVKPASHRGRGGAVTPVFNYAELADGKKIAIVGTLTEVFQSQKSDHVRVSLDGDLRGRGPSHLMETAVVAGAAASGGIAGVGIGVATGIGGLLGAVFLPRGHEAVLREGAVIGVRLARSTVIATSAAPPVASRLMSRTHQEG